MPKKRTNKRLDRIFEGIQQEGGQIQPPAPPAATPPRGRTPTPRQPRTEHPAPAAGQLIAIPGSGTPAAPASLSVAFRTDEQSWATLQIMDEQAPRTWDAEEQALVRQVADQLSLALENARLFQLTQARAEELAILNEMSRALSASLDLHAILENILAYSSRLIETKHFFIAFYYPERQEMEMALALSNGERIQPFRRPLGKSLSDHIVRTGQPLLLNGDIPAQMKAMGLEVVALGNTTPAKSWLGVPMVIGEQVIGVIAVQSLTTPYQFNERHRDLLTAIASQSAIAVQNARLFEQARLRAEELAVLNEVARNLSAHLDIDSIVRETHRGLSRLMDATTFYIGLYNADRNEITFPYSVNESRIDSQIGTISADQGLTGYIVRTRKPLLIKSNVKAEVEKLGIAMLGEPAASWLGVPLLIGQQVYGAMVVQNYKIPNAYDEHSLDLMTAFASQATIAIQNAQLYEQARRRAEELAALNELARALTSRLNLQQVLQETYRGVRQLMNARNFYIGLYDPASHTVRFPINVTESKIDQEIAVISADQGLSGYLLRTREPLLIKDDLQGWMNAHGMQPVGEPAASWLGVPLQIGDQVIGVMAVQDYRTPNAFDEHHRDLLIAAASQAAVAIQNARLFEETQRRAFEVGTLAEIANDIATTRELDPILQRLAEKARQYLSVTDIAIYLLQPGTDRLKARISLGTYQEEVSAQEIRLGEGLAGHIAQSGNAEIINDPMHDPRAISIPGIPTDDEPEEIMMVAPILSRGKAIGAITVWRRREMGLFVQSELDFLVNLARQAAVAIDSVSLYQETVRRANEMAALNDIVMAASQSLDLHVIFETVLTKVLQAVKFDGGLITMWNEQGGTLDRVVRIGMPGTPPADPALDIENTLCGYVFRTEKALAIEDMTKGAPVDVSKEVEAGLHSYLGVPLEVKGRVLGTLCVFRHDPGPVDPGAVALMQTMGRQIGFAIENAMLFRQMQASEARFRDVALSSADLVWELDRDGRYVYCSERVADVLGYRPDEMLGHRPAEFIAPGEQETAIQKFEEVVRAGERMTDLEIPHRTLDGHEVILLASGVPIRDAEGRSLGFRGVYKDITERRTAEKIQQAIYAISEASLNARNIQDLIRAAHEAIATLVPARNLYVAMYDARQDLLSFPYYVDEHDAGWEPHRPGRGLTSYVLRTGRTLLATPEVLDELERSGQVQSGGTRSVDWLGVPLRARGAVIGVLAVQSYDPKVRLTEAHRDILNLLSTQVASALDRFQSAQELLKFKLGLERSTEAAFITDLNGAILYANPAFEQIYGYPPSEVIGQTPRILKSGLIPPEQYKHFWDTLLSGGTVAGEIVNRRRDGRLVYIEGSNTPILDETGQMLGFLAMHRDVTARKQAEEQLRRQNEYLAAAAEVSRLVSSTLDLTELFERAVNLIRERFGYYHAAIFTLDESGFNAVVREASGPAAEEMKRSKHALPVGSRSVVGTAVANGQPVVVNNTAIDPTHRPNPLLPETRSEAAIPLRIGVRVIGALDLQASVVDAFRPDDVTVLQILADQIAVAIDNARSYELAQQAVREMREVDRLKTQFLANMSHELRTPLNSIIGFSRVILKGIDGPITDLQQQDLTAIYNSGQHLLGLINDILDLSRIEAGKMELAFDEVHLADLVTSVMSTTAGLVKDKPIKLHTHIAPDLPPVRADQMRVRQVLLNLLSNAAKFTDQGSITVDVHPQIGPAGRPEILISVSDTGPGIAPEDQDKLFQPFSQVDASPTRKTGGTGLGLSICQHLVQMHGGRIGLHSAPGKGSTFYFTLPVYRAGEGASEPGNRIVLAIDDDPQVIALYERYLQPQGYQVIALTDPTRARERVRQLRPFAVTLDIMMPGYDGWKVITDLKSDPDTRSVPVIICSILEEHDKGISLGAADYLVKPILEEDLINALNRLNNDGSIREVLVIDDDPDDLRLIGKILAENGRYRPVLAEGGTRGWEAIMTRPPHALILDLFMPEMDGFAILEKMRASRALRDIPVIIVTGGDLTPAQREQLNGFAQRLIQKGSLNESELLGALESALRRVAPQ